MHAATDAPLIAGIDTKFGLKMTGGKRERYESLLRKFARQQGEAVETIRAALSVGDTEKAEREAHSLKGAASTLGAAALAECSAQVENAIRAGRSVGEPLEALSHSLIAVVDSIRIALPD